MHFSKIMVAVAALAASSAFAAPSAGKIAIVSGASASKANFALALANRCTAAGGVMTEFASGTNLSTYVCAPSTLTGATYTSTPDASFVPFSGSTLVEVRLNVTGGSFSAVCLSKLGTSSWNTGSCATVNAGGAADTYVDPATGTAVAAPANTVVMGGLLDVAPDKFPASVIGNLLVGLPGAIDAGFFQTFGVAANDTLYTAMFNAQKSRGLLNAACLVTDTAQPGCVPQVGKPQMAALLVDSEFGGLYSTQGARFFAWDVAAGTTLNYVRRVDTSGTQAAAQVYFLNAGNGGNLPVVPQGAACTNTGTTAVNGGSLIGTVNVCSQSTTGNLRNILNVNAAGVYSIGILSGENINTGTWKWLRVGGMNIGENATPSLATTNTNTTLACQYDYYFRSVIQTPATSATITNFWNAVKTGFAAVPAGTTKGLFSAAEASAAGNAGGCQPTRDSEISPAYSN